MDGVAHQLAVHEVALVYPSESLSRQIATWARRRTDCIVAPVFVRSLPEIRRAVRHVDAVIVDATEDYVQAVDAFSQAAACLGAHATTVYAERMHEGLELFVRMRGSLLLFGPLSDVQWEDFLDLSLHPHRRKRRWGMVA